MQKIGRGEAAVTGWQFNGTRITLGHFWGIFEAGIKVLGAA